MFTCRPAIPADAQACAQIIRLWAADTPWMTSLNSLEEMSAWWKGAIENLPSWSAEEDGLVVGFCVREDDNITGLYVASSARGRGVGKQLLDLAKQDRDWITVWAYEKNTNARRFYRREGLVEVSRETETYDDGVSLVDVEHRWIRPGATPLDIPSSG